MPTMVGKAGFLTTMLILLSRFDSGPCCYEEFCAGVTVAVAN